MLDLRFFSVEREAKAAGTSTSGASRAKESGVGKSMVRVLRGPTFAKRFDLLRLGNSRLLPHPFRISIHVPGKLRRVNETLSQGPFGRIVADEDLSTLRDRAAFVTLRGGAHQP